MLLLIHAFQEIITFYYHWSRYEKGVSADKNNMFDERNLLGPFQGIQIRKVRNDHRSQLSTETFTIEVKWSAKWNYDDVIKWKQFPRYWSFVRGIHRSPVNSPHKGQWRGAVMFSLICAWINGWVNNRETGDLRRHRAHYDITVMITRLSAFLLPLAKWDLRRRLRVDIQYTHTSPNKNYLVHGYTN